MTPGNAANIRDRAAPRRTVDSGLGARTAASHGGAAAAHLSCCPPRQREGACAAHRGRPRSPTRDSHFTILTARTRRSASATKWSPASAQRRSLDCAKWWRWRSPAKGSCFTFSSARTGRSASATKLSPASAQRTSLNCAEWWRGALRQRVLALRTRPQGRGACCLLRISPLPLRRG
jgi:hypothetical protein